MSFTYASCLTLALAFFANKTFAALTIYTDRPQVRFEKVVATFTKETGQKVTFIEAAYPDLIKQIEKDKTALVGDLIITKDLIYLSELTQKRLLQRMSTSRKINSVHPFMKDQNSNWVGLTFRARTAVFDPSRVNRNELTSYEDLASAKWQGRLCLRTGKAAYNEALIANLVTIHGKEKTKTIVAGWLKNLAAPSFPNDTVLIQAIANGQCDVGLVNHYYLAGELNKNPNLPVQIAFLEQASHGVHTNGTGVGILVGSKNQEFAEKFIDLLLDDTFLQEFSAAHFDYPAAIHLQPTTFIKDWGVFKINNKPWSEVGANVTAARELITEVGYQ